MTRRFILMLAALIVLQFSWGTVAAYCMHETGIKAQHLGHHAHAEPSDDAGTTAKDKPAQVKKGLAHTHCASCAHGTMMGVSFDGTTSPQVPAILAAHPESANASVYAPPPERPQWRLPA